MHQKRVTVEREKTTIVHKQQPIVSMANCEKLLLVSTIRLHRYDSAFSRQIREQASERTNENTVRGKDTLVGITVSDQLLWNLPKTEIVGLIAEERRT